MQKSSKSPAAAQQFDMLLFDGFSNHCLANAVEPLRAANTLSGKTLYAWRYASVSGKPVTSSSGLEIAIQHRLSDLSGDMLLVMPSYGYKDHCDWQTLNTVRSASQRYPTLAGLDTGAWLLAEAGLLKGHRATIHWDEFEEFAASFPNITAERARIIHDKSRVTCTGAATTFDLLHGLISQAHGPTLALEVAQIFMMRTTAADQMIEPSARTKRARAALNLMQNNIETPLSINQIARHLGCSQKTLTTRIKDEFGIPPNALYRRLRLARARKLLQETDLKISEISIRCGYDNASAMSRAFLAEFNQTPSELRR